MTAKLLSSMSSGDQLLFYSIPPFLLFRWTAGPRVNGVEPILVVFENKNDKEQLWMKLSIKMRDDMLERRESVIVTQVRRVRSGGRVEKRRIVILS